MCCKLSSKFSVLILRTICKFSLCCYHYLLLLSFHISVSWWSFTRDWVTASLLRSPGLFWVFWQIAAVQCSGWYQSSLLLLSLLLLVFHTSISWWYFPGVIIIIIIRLNLQILMKIPWYYRVTQKKTEPKLFIFPLN